MKPTKPTNKKTYGVITHISGKPVTQKEVDDFLKQKLSEKKQKGKLNVADAKFREEMRKLGKDVADFFK